MKKSSYNSSHAKRGFGFSNLTYKTQKIIVFIAFLTIPLAFLVVLGYLPVFNMFGYSLTKWNGISKTKEYVGLKNFQEVFSRPEYFKVFFVSIYYLVGSFVQIALALLFATMLNFKMKGQNLFKGIFFFPNLINGVAIGFIFIYFFRPDGTLDSFLSLLGLKDYIQLWLQNQHINNISLTGVSIWRYMGFNLVLFLGAMQSISADVYEASDLDGANRWKQFWYIIFPSIKPIISLNLILAVKGALSVFDIPYIMMTGGNGTATFVIKTVQTAFTYNKVGLASAMAVVLTIIVIIIAAIQQLLFKEDRQ